MALPPSPKGDLETIFRDTRVIDVLSTFTNTAFFKLLVEALVI